MALHGNIKNPCVLAMRQVYDAANKSDQASARAWMKILLADRPQATGSPTRGFERLDRIQAVLAHPMSTDSMLVAKSLQRERLWKSSDDPRVIANFVERVRKSPRQALMFHRRSKKPAVVE